jgi:hypothetical protein
MLALKQRDQKIAQLPSCAPHEVNVATAKAGKATDV